MVSLIQQMEYSVQAPNPFIQNNLHRILPEWDCPAQSVLVVLQRSPYAFLQRTTETERWKEHLRQGFFQFAEVVSSKLVESGYCVEIFDPKNGLPTASQSGELCLSDVATAHALLHYPVYRVGGCMLLMHPKWGSAVYPSTLITSAPLSWLSQSSTQAYRQLNLA
jgi:Methylmalonic aciduria and homocystinuria type D protein